MTSEGLGEMFEGVFTDTFRWCRWRAEQRVERVQTRERGPPSAPVEIQCIFDDISNILTFLYSLNVDTCTEYELSMSVHLLVSRICA